MGVYFNARGFFWRPGMQYGAKLIKSCWSLTCHTCLCLLIWLLCEDANMLHSTWRCNNAWKTTQLLPGCLLTEKSVKIKDAEQLHHTFLRRCSIVNPRTDLLNHEIRLNSSLSLSLSRWPPLGGLGVMISLGLISLFNWPGTFAASGPVVWLHARLK